jgi:hypothetical protein
MKSLSPETLAVIDKPYVEPVKLLRIAFEGGFTLRLCGQVWGAPGEECFFDGEIYEPVVLSWGANNHGEIDPVSYEVNPGETEVIIDNAVPIGGAERFTELFATYNPHYATAEIVEIFVGATAATDQVYRFKGRIEDTLDMETDRVTLTLSGIELDIANRFNHTIITTDAFPSADPDDVGAMLGQGYGRLKRAPFRAIDAGNRTALVAAIGAGDTSIAISDATGFPASGTVQIELEKVTYTGISANTLTGCARGQSGTTAASHDAGAAVSEVQSEYVYAWGHPIQVVEAVYVDRIRQSGNYTAYTGLSGDEHPSYPGRAVVAFNTMPSLNKQINIDDQISVDQGNHQHGGFAYTTLFAEAVLSNSGIDYPERIPGNNFDTQAFVPNGASGDFNFLGYKDPGGTPNRCRVGLVYRRPVGSSDARIRVRFYSGSTIATRVSLTHGDYEFHNAVSEWVNCSLTWAQISAGRFIVDDYDITGNHINCCCVWLDVEHTVDASEATGVEKLGTVVLSGNSGADVVIGSQVAADLRGWQDDIAGTYTGTPFGLIEQPADICKHILMDRCGLSVSVIGASYAAAGTFFAAQNYRLGVAVLERPNARELLNQIAVQSCSLEFWEAGTHQIVPVSGDITAVKTLTADRIDQGQTRLQFTPRIDIVNRITGRYDREWSGHTDKIEADRAVVNAENAASIVDFGTLEGKQNSFPFIIDQQQAVDVLALRLKEQAFPRIEIEFASGYSAMDLERGDVFTFDFIRGDVLDKILLRLINPNTDLFRIMDTVDKDAAIYFKAVFVVSQFDFSASMAADTETAPAMLVLDFDISADMASGTDTPAVVLVLLNELTATASAITQTSAIEVLNVGATLELSASMPAVTLTPSANLSIEFTIVATISGVTATATAELFNPQEINATMAGVTQTAAIDIGGTSPPVPAGLIVPFNGNPASIPTGWSLWNGGSEANFVKGAAIGADPVVSTGGSDTVSPNLVLSEAGEHLAIGSTFYTRGFVGGLPQTLAYLGTQAAGGHTHTLASFNYTPPYGSFPFMIATADHDDFPINAVVLGAGSLSGLANLISMAGRSLRIDNAAPPGTGGNNTPTADLTAGGNHHHHSGFADTYWGNFHYTYNTVQMAGQHTPTGVTINVTPDLKRKLLSAWTHASAVFEPDAGMIGMWESWTPPSGWAVCDGTGGTPDLRDCFIEIVVSGSENTAGTGDHTIDISVDTTHGFGSHSHESGTSDDSEGRVLMRHTAADFSHQHTGTLNNHSWLPSYRTVVFVMKTA